MNKETTSNNNSNNNINKKKKKREKDVTCMTSPAQDTDTLTPPHTLTISFQNEMMRFLPICQLRCEFNIYIYGLKNAGWN